MIGMMIGQQLLKPLVQLNQQNHQPLVFSVVICYLLAADDWDDDWSTPKTSMHSQTADCRLEFISSPLVDDAPKAMRSARSTKKSTMCKIIQVFRNTVAVDDWDDEPVQQNASTQGKNSNCSIIQR